MPAQWSHAAGFGTIGSCLEHAAASTHIWRPARATPVLIWRERAGRFVSQRASPEDAPGPAPPRAFASPVPTSTPPPSTLAPPPVPSLAWSSSAGSRRKLLIALHQPGTGVIWRGASQRAIKGDATHSQPQSHAARRALHSTPPVAAPADPPARASAVRSGCSLASPTDRQPDPVPTPPPSGPWPLRVETRGERLEVE